MQYIIAMSFCAHTAHAMAHTDCISIKCFFFLYIVLQSFMIDFGGKDVLDNGMENMVVTDESEEMGILSQFAAENQQAEKRTSKTFFL